MAAYRPADGTVRLQGIPQPIFTSGPNEIAVPADYNGDGKADVATWSPTTGNWTMLLTGEGRAVAQWGLPGDVPAPADYDGDGRADLAVFRPPNGVWYIKGDGRLDPAVWSPATQQFTVTGQAPARLGDPGDTPVPGQYDGDGKADLAVYHDGRFDVRARGRYEVGAPGDVPMPLN